MRIFQDGQFLCDLSHQASVTVIASSKGHSGKARPAGGLRNLPAKRGKKTNVWRE